jgi:histidinol-phosphatase
MGQLVERAYSTRGYGDFVHYHLLARGALEVVIESDISILDVAALTAIIREAGGTLTDLEGQPPSLQLNSVLAANGPQLHAAVLEMLNSART